MLYKDYIIVQSYRDFPDPEALAIKKAVGFYKMLHLTSGGGIFMLGVQIYLLNPGDVIFLNPGESFTWQISNETNGHLCLIHPNYFEPDAKHIVKLINDYKLRETSGAVIQLRETQSLTINEHFKMIIQENENDLKDKRESILINLQMILLEIQRAVKKIKENNTSKISNRFLSSFLHLSKNSRPNT
jgi:AraC family transcriptional activator of pobA